MKILDCCDQDTELDRARPPICSAASTVCCMWPPHGNVFAGNGATGSSCAVYLSLHTCDCVLCCVKKHTLLYVSVCQWVIVLHILITPLLFFSLEIFKRESYTHAHTPTHTHKHMRTHTHTGKYNQLSKQLSDQGCC